MEILITHDVEGLEKFQVTDREECGVIVEAKDRSYILRVPNVAIEKTEYAIRKDDVEKISAVLSDDEAIVGYFHTHLAHQECEPSDVDIEGATLSPGFINLIYKPSTGEYCWYAEVGAIES